MSIMQTPPRALPGNWLQTPAQRLGPQAPSFQSPGPVVRRNSNMPPATTDPALTVTNTRPDTTVQAPTRIPEPLKPAERAARTINEALLNETRFPELDNYLSPGYSCEYDVQSSVTWAPFQKVRVHKIPDEIFDQYNRAQVSTSMGLFAELQYAWVTIDNALYMWDYSVNNPELLGFESQPNSITSVRLALPKPGVFLPNIQHIIILATTAEVMLLGLGIDPAPGSSNTLSLFQTGMSVSVKGLLTTVISASSKTGRVFFGGRTENEVYELTYQQEDRWFSSRCSKVCHTGSKIQALGLSLSFGQAKPEFLEQIVVDDSRDLLYTLSSQSAIRVFHMKADGSLSLLITKPATEIYSNIGHIITQSESLNSRIPIVSISAIPASEASRYHLVATTATGYRIYLSATSSGYWSNNRAGAPISMQAQHVKTPPMTDPNPPAQPGVQQNVQAPIKSLTMTRLAQRYPPGYFFCFVASSADAPTDNLFISAPDAPRLLRPPEAGQPARTSESAVWLSLGSRTEDIGLSTPYSAASSTPAGFGNDLAVQFDKPIPEVAVLTNTGIHILKRRRFVDIFAALIRQGGGPEGFQNEVNNLIRHYGRTETLATALAVACGQGVEVTQDARAVRVNDPEVLDVARKTFIDYGGKPSINQNAITDKSMPLVEAVRPSPRHSAIALYLSRLLRSIWKTPITSELQSPTGYSILSAVPVEKLKYVQEDLSALKRFFVANKTFIKGLSGPDDLSRTSSKDDEIALQGEHRALHSLVKFVSDTIEGISFVLVLFEERVADIVPLLPELSRPQFLQLTYEELFTTDKGTALAKELVKAIVNRNIAKGSNVETVAEALRRKCGSFCSPEDVIIFKAQEQLKRAAETDGNLEFARNLLNESLKLFEQVAQSLPVDYLESAVKQYVQLNFFAGAIQLVLKVAHELDKANEALSWMADGSPEGDSRQAKWQARNQRYDLIHDVLIAVDMTMEQSPAFLDGRPTPTATRRDEAYDVIARSKDDVFFTNLYDWYLSQGWHEKLLASESPFIETYLQRRSTENITYADLLWKYFGQNGQFHEAAQVQFQLANSSLPLTLDQRIEYLSRARANASAFSTGGNRKQRQKLLQQITELLDIASVQCEVLQRLKDDPRLPADRREEVLEQVDGPILDVSELYNKYADNAGYYDICLMIYHIADHRDASQVKQTWQQLLQATHDRTIAKGEPLPFEAVASEVRSLGLKLRTSESTFPVATLLTILERYAFEHQRNEAPPHWVVDIFLSLEIPHERLYDVLETMFFTNEHPFVGSNRRFIADDLIYIISGWFHDTTKVSGVVFGSEPAAERVEELLTVMLQNAQVAGLDERILGQTRILRERIASLLG